MNGTAPRTLSVWTPQPNVTDLGHSTHLKGPADWPGPHPVFYAARFLVAVLMLLVGGSAAIVVSLLPGERVWLWLLCQTICYGFEGLAARSHLDDSTAD